MLKGFLHHSLSYSLRQVSPLDLELTDMADVASQPAPGVLFVLLQSTGITGGPPQPPGVHVGDGSPNSSPHTCMCMASSYPLIAISLASCFKILSLLSCF